MAPLACISKKRVEHEENQTKYRNNNIIYDQKGSESCWNFNIAKMGYYGYKIKEIENQPTYMYMFNIIYVKRILT